MKRSYASTERGKETNRKSTARWVSSEKGKEYHREWDTTEKGAERFRRWRKSPKGRAAGTKNNELKRGVPHENAMRIAKLIGEGKAICYWCSKPATDVEHVLPIGMARITGLLDIVDDYVDAICHNCHKLKTNIDRRDIHRMKKELTI